MTRHYTAGEVVGIANLIADYAAYTHAPLSRREDLTPEKVARAIVPLVIDLVIADQKANVVQVALVRRAAEGGAPTRPAFALELCDEIDRLRLLLDRIGELAEHGHLNCDHDRSPDAASALHDIDDLCTKEMQ